MTDRDALREAVERLPVAMAYMNGDDEGAERLTVVVSKDAVRAALAQPAEPGLDAERLARKLREWMNVVLNERTPKYLSDDIGTLIAAGDEQGYRELAKRILAEKLEADHD